VEEDMVIQKENRCPRRKEIEYSQVPEALKAMEEDMVIQKKIRYPRRRKLSVCRLCQEDNFQTRKNGIQNTN
jgi:hypothetical protein